MGQDERVDEEDNSDLDFSAGPLRAKRMREALQEAVCLVKIRCDSMDWPILYASRQFSDALGIWITPPERLCGSASAVGSGLKACRATVSGSQLNLWDCLQLTGKSSQQLMSELRQPWENQDAGVFALTAAMPVPHVRSSECRHDMCTERIPVN